MLLSGCPSPSPPCSSQVNSYTSFQFENTVASPPTVELENPGFIPLAPTLTASCVALSKLRNLLILNFPICKRDTHYHLCKLLWEGNVSVRRAQDLASIQLASNGSQHPSATSLKPSLCQPTWTWQDAAEPHRTVYHVPFVPSVYFLIFLHALVDYCRGTHRMMQYLQFTQRVRNILQY